MNGVIYTLLEEFNTHLYPRAVELEKRLARGELLEAGDVVHLAEVAQRMREIRPLVEAHPELKSLAAGVMRLYTDLARHACRNELQST